MTRARPEGRRLRVVFVDHVARLSGGEIALQRMLPSLAERVDVHVILGEEGPLVERLRADGISVEVMPLAEDLRDLRKGTVRAGKLDPRALVRLPAYVWRLKRRIRELDADLVHTNSLKAALYGGAAGRLARVPVVWHVRDRIADDYLPHSAVRLVRAAARVLPTAVITNSEATLQTLPRARHARVVYNPVIPDAVEPRGAFEPRETLQTKLGVIGRLAHWKGQHVFLAGFAEAFAGTDARGRVIGDALFGEEAYAEELEAQARRLGIADQIEFRGFREDIWAELAELDVLVHCSVVPEPFGQVVLEGMAAGVPVIAADAGGPAELITSGVDGMLTPPGDVHALATAMRTLHEDMALRVLVGRAGHRRSRDFKPQQTAAKILAVYGEIYPP